MERASILMFTTIAAFNVPLEEWSSVHEVLWKYHGHTLKETKLIESWKNYVKRKFNQTILNFEVVNSIIMQEFLGEDNVMEQWCHIRGMNSDYFFNTGNTSE